MSSLIKLPDQKERQLKSLLSREVKNVANDVKTAANNSEVQRKGKSNTNQEFEFRRAKIATEGDLC